MTLLLIRHGDAGGDGRLVGHLDPPLSDTGRKQAEYAAKQVGGLSIQKIYSSGLVRAAQTAAPISRQLGLPVQQADALNERRFGLWEGMTTAQVHEADPAGLAALWSDPGFCPPEGESHLDHGDRANLFLQSVVDEHQNETVVVVAHGGTVRAILGHHLKMELPALMGLTIGYCRGVLLTLYGDGGAQVGGINLPPSCWADGLTETPPPGRTAQPHGALIEDINGT